MNTFIDKTRKKQLKVVKLPATDEEEEANPIDLVADATTGNPEREMEGSRIDEHIQRALESLSEQERVVFVMRHYQDMALKEISLALDIAEGTVKSLLFRSIRKLRKSLSFYRDEMGLEDSL
jgi:RNA polymerase sigma-70 factor (ECF subfamily)